MYNCHVFAKLFSIFELLSTIYYKCSFFWGGEERGTLMLRTLLSVKLHDVSKFRGIITFTGVATCRNLTITWFERRFLRSYWVHRAVWQWASLKVQKGHTKVNIKLIRGFDVENIVLTLKYDTIYEELLHSQGSTRCHPPIALQHAQAITIPLQPMGLRCKQFF